MNLNPAYALSTGRNDEERLEILNEVYNPQTLPFLRKKIQPGMSVADVGCGLGIVSAELSQMVGPQEKSLVLISAPINFN